MKPRFQSHASSQITMATTVHAAIMAMIRRGLRIGQHRPGAMQEAGALRHAVTQADSPAGQVMAQAT